MHTQHILVSLGIFALRIACQESSTGPLTLENPDAGPCFPDADVANSTAPCEIAQYTMAKCSMTTNTVLNFTANQKCLCESSDKSFFPAYVACWDCVRKNANSNFTLPDADVVASQSSIFCGARVTGGLNAFYAALSTAVPPTPPNITFVTMTAPPPEAEPTSTGTGTAMSSSTKSGESSTMASRTGSATAASATQTGAATSGFDELKGSVAALGLVAAVALFF